MKPGRDLVAATLLTVAVGAGAAFAGRKAPDPPPLLSVEHVHPSGAFLFRTPDGWRVVSPAGKPEAIEAWGGELGLRFVYRPGEPGYDSLHADCMLERLAGPMEAEPQVKYEYEFVGGIVGNRRALDSAFVVTYNEPRHGHREWRQRTVTVVGEGDSLCVSTYVPREVWKSSRAARVLIDSVLASVTFQRR
jgi:hypothetical protein